MRGDTGEMQDRSRVRSVFLKDEGRRGIITLCNPKRMLRFAPRCGNYTQESN